MELACKRLKLKSQTSFVNVHLDRFNQSVLMFQTRNVFLDRCFKRESYADLTLLQANFRVKT